MCFNEYLSHNFTYFLNIIFSFVFLFSLKMSSAQSSSMSKFAICCEATCVWIRRYSLCLLWRLSWSGLKRNLIRKYNFKLKTYQRLLLRSVELVGCHIAPFPGFDRLNGQDKDNIQHQHLNIIRFKNSPIIKTWWPSISACPRMPIFASLTRRSCWSNFALRTLKMNIN